MSLRLRVGTILQMLFVINPDGLSIKDFERMIKIYEGKYFDLYEAQSGIVDGLDLMKKPPLERRFLNKPSSYNGHNFWVYKEEKYYPHENIHLYDKPKEIIKKIEKGEKIENYDHYCLFQDKLVSILDENKQGIEFNELYTNFKNFYSLFEKYDQEEIESTFCSLMKFEDKPPYETVYFDKKRPEEIKYRDFSYAENPFREWEYRNGLYYPNEKFLNNPEIQFKDPEGAKRYYISKIEDLTLLDQIRGYAKLNNLTDFEFLNMHAFMQANLDASRKI
jgi:hypothetical protein